MLQQGRISVNPLDERRVSLFGAERAESHEITNFRRVPGLLVGVHVVL